jgi:hypothetical protein
MKQLVKPQVEESELEKLYEALDESGCECHQACKFARVYSDEDEDEIIF